MRRRGVASRRRTQRARTTAGLWQANCLCVISLLAMSATHSSPHFACLLRPATLRTRWERARALRHCAASQWRVQGRRTLVFSTVFQALLSLRFDFKVGSFFYVNEPCNDSCLKNNVIAPAAAGRREPLLRRRRRRIYHHFARHFALLPRRSVGRAFIIRENTFDEVFGIKLVTSQIHTVLKKG